jgi:hypothetical protein
VLARVARIASRTGSSNKMGPRQLLLRSPPPRASKRMIAPVPRRSALVRTPSGSENVGHSDFHTRASRSVEGGSLAIGGSDGGGSGEAAAGAAATSVGGAVGVVGAGAWARASDANKHAAPMPKKQRSELSEEASNLQTLGARSRLTSASSG